MCKSTKAVKRGGFEKFIKVHIENYMCIFFFEIHIIKIRSVSQVMHGCDYYVKISKKCGFNDIAKKYANIANNLANQSQNQLMKQQASELIRMLN